LKLYENLKIFSGAMNELYKFQAALFSFVSMIMLDILDTDA